MLHNLRHDDRYPLAGEASLSAAGHTVTGEIVDISLGGIALRLDRAAALQLNGQKTWRCHVDSPDLPAAIEFLVRVIRQRTWLGGMGIACMITAIDERPLVFLKAYRSLAIARAHPLPGRKRPDAGN